MKKHINFYAIGYLVVSLIAIGCIVYSVTALLIANDFFKVKRRELDTGYRLEHKTLKSKFVFEHNSVKNVDKLRNLTDQIWYIDYGCDDVVDRIHLTAGYTYERGESGTNVLFQNADKEYAKIKKGMGLESNYRAQSDVAEPNPKKIHFYWDIKKK